MVKILGTGSYLPEKVLTNFDLEKMVETTDEWIVQRTGIKERRIVKDNEFTSDLAVNASLNALEMANRSPKEVDLLILATSTPDYHIPSCAPTVAYKLGCRNITAFDINSVCTSFMCGFASAYSMIEAGLYKNCLLIGADTYSRILNWEDRNTCVIFGDGAGAVYMEKSDQGRILSLDFGSDGSGEDYIKIPVGGVVKPVYDYYGYNQEDFYFKMAGKKVYEFTISVIPESAKKMLNDANISNNDIDYVILHQANIRIIDTISKMLDIDRNKFLVNIEKYGNTSSASIPIVIDEFVRNGVIKKGNKVLMLGFGGGLSWGGVIYEW